MVKTQIPHTNKFKILKTGVVSFLIQIKVLYSITIRQKFSLKNRFSFTEKKEKFLVNILLRKLKQS